MILWLAVALFFNSTAYGAPCCAGSSAIPTVITGDDFAQLSAGASVGFVIGDAPAQGLPVFRSPDNSELTQTYHLDGAILLSDRFQAGGSLPVVVHSISRPDLQGSAASMGDIRADLAYEFLPELTYSVWKPKGYVFLQGTIPLARSIYEAQAAGAIDATSKGLFSLSLGTVWVKHWSSWDVFAVPEIHYSFARNFTSPATGETISVTPGWGGSLTLGGGFSPWSGPFRIGFSIQPVYNQAKISYQLAWDTDFSASYLINSAWTVVAAYSDQTLFGPAVLSTLNRVLALSIQHRWDR